VGQILLKTRLPRKYSWPVKICGTDTFKNKNFKKIFSHIFPLAKNIFLKFLFLKVSVPHIHTDQEYFLGIVIFKSTCPTD
jgi:hypothetical protein